MENRNTPRPENTSADAARKRIEQVDFSEDEAAGEMGDTPDVDSEADLHLGGDTGFDRVVTSDEAGLGGGLDQAEEAQLGVTDEELAEMARRRGVAKKE